jgi:hypothetical protein
MPTEAVTNEDKSKVLADTFFPPPPLLSAIPEDYNYPNPATPFKLFTKEQINRTISNTSSYKAPGPDGICNIVFKRAASTLVPYILHLFNAVFTLSTYFDPCREFTTMVQAHILRRTQQRTTRLERSGREASKGPENRYTKYHWRHEIYSY